MFYQYSKRQTIVCAFSSGANDPQRVVCHMCDLIVTHLGTIVRIKKYLVVNLLSLLLVEIVQNNWNFKP